MGVYLVRVEAWDKTGNGWYHDVTVLAHTERSARQMATRFMAKLELTGAHSVEAAELDHSAPAVVAVHRATAEAPHPLFTKEVAI